MSVQKIIKESINMNPLEMKEAIAEELRARVALALEAKMKDDEEDEDEDDMKEELDLSNYTIEELEDFMVSEDFDELNELDKKTLVSYIRKAAGNPGKDGNTLRDLRAKSRAHKTLGNDSEADKYKAKAKQRDAGIAKAVARTAAQTGTFMGNPGAPTLKAAKKMPQSYYKTETEE
jgi:hypothetical protein